MPKIFLIILVFFCFTSKAQQLIHQDIFHGGVTVGASSEGLLGSTTLNSIDTLQLYVENGSQIRNAWLFYYRMGKPDPKALNVNGITIMLDTMSGVLISKSKSQMPGVDSIYVYRIDLSDYLSNSSLLGGTFIINNPGTVLSQTDGFVDNWGYCMPVVYIEYELSSLPIISTSLFAHKNDQLGYQILNFVGANTRVYNSPFAFSMFLDRICGNFIDGEKVYINNSFKGMINNSDSTTYLYDCSGAQGTYYFQNNQITGLYDDTPDNTVGGGDALLDLNGLVSSSNNFTLLLEHEKGPNTTGAWVNSKILFSQAYSTPCDTFATSITADTILCFGDSVLITASGGNAYRWLNHTTLSDSIGNTVWAKPTENTMYTVQIENTPGCSRTENVAVKIHPSPKLNSVVIDTATCGEEDGKLTVNTSQNGVFQFNIGFGYQNSRYFNGVPAGTYLVQAKDYMGCVQELEVELPYKIEAQASFEANPTEGAKPLHVDLENNSQNASDYNWYFNGSYFSDYEHENLLIDQSGEHFIDLIVFNKDSICADTASIKIFVYDSLVLKIPNVFTPNGDGNNDVFSLQQNGAIAITYQIYNRWGSPVQSGEFKSPNEILVLWDGVDQTSQKPVNPATFFYAITATNLQGEQFEFEGFVQVVR